LDIKNSFYEREEVVESLVSSERSEVAFNVIRNIIMKRFSLKRELRFLEIGCGTGEFLERVSNLGEQLKVWGVDISELAINKVKKRGVSGFVLDVSRQKLPFPDDFFDMIYMGDVVEHLVDPDFMILEVKRTLRDGGYLILTTPNLASWYNRILLTLGFQPIFSEVSTKKIFGRPGEKVVGHLRLFTLRSLKEFLSYYRFEIIDVKGVCFHAFNSLLKLIDRFFSHFPSLSSIILIVAANKSDRSQ